MSRPRRRRAHRDATAFVALDRPRCEACWACLEACPQEVFGKVDLLGHRHAKIRNAGVCTGCGRCVKACEAGALTRLEGTVQARRTDPETATAGAAAAPRLERAAAPAGTAAATPPQTAAAAAPRTPAAPGPDPALPPA